MAWHTASLRTAGAMTFSQHFLEYLNILGLVSHETLQSLIFLSQLPQPTRLGNLQPPQLLRHL